MPASSIGRFVVATLVLVAGLSERAGAQQGGMEDATLAIPNVALTFAPGYLAEDWGLFAKQGLNLKSVVSPASAPPMRSFQEARILPRYRAPR